MTCSKALKKLICGFSALLLCAVTLGSDLTQFRASIEGAKSERALEEAILAAPESLGSEPILQEYIGHTVDQLEHIGTWQDVQTRILATIDARLDFEGAQTGKVDDPSAAAKEILENPIYTGRDQRQSRNWLDNSASRIGERILKWLESLFPDRQPTYGGSGLPSTSISGFTAVAWFLIGAVILLVAYFVFRNFKIVGRRRRRVGGILEDDEPERTADQWLAQAEKLESEGKYREAVRCLYLACLVRYDDGRVARFRRHETNWEHLYRIEGSPLNPGLDFRSPTQRFDKVWYGFQVDGPSDVQSFREVYQRLCEQLQLKSAA
jgi:hypothetical protein